MLNVKKIRKYFPAITSKRIVSNNAASTQAPIQLVKLLEKLIIDYDNVHRGQSNSSIITTKRFESAYDTIAQFINAPSRNNIILYRNTTEAINSIMYSLLTEFKDGDNIVTTFMEHNSNYVPWYGLCKEILPKFGIRVEYRLVKFDKQTGELDLEHLKSLVDKRTKIVCCTGASNFLGTINPIEKVKEVADKSGYIQPDGEKRSYLLVDGAQLVPNTFIDVSKLKVDFLVWSFHKMLAPFGIGALYANTKILNRIKPFLYGGDMVSGMGVGINKVHYNELPWKFTAGTPNILGTIISSEAIRLLIDFGLDKNKYFTSGKKLNQKDVKKAMDNIRKHEIEITEIILKELSKIPTLKIFGPKDALKRTSLVSFMDKNKDPFKIAKELNKLGVESRAGCHCATLAHKFYNTKPLASCRVSFYVYNDIDDIKKVCEAIKKILKYKDDC